MFKTFGFGALIIAGLVVWATIIVIQDNRKNDREWDSARVYHVTTSEVVGDAKVLHLAETDSVLIVPTRMNPEVEVALIKMIRYESLFFCLYNAKGAVLTSGDSRTGFYFFPPNVIK